MYSMVIQISCGEGEFFMLIDYCCIFHCILIIGMHSSLTGKRIEFLFGQYIDGNILCSALVRSSIDV